jgi:uncharacterized repeat protein (TIGR01451 family)
MFASTQAAVRRQIFAASLALCAGLWAPAKVMAAGPGPEDPGSLVAVGSGPLETEFVAEKLATKQRADGSTEKRFVEARRLRAGEEVYYTIRVRNPGKEPVQDVVVTKRMPFGVAYVRGSAAGPSCDVEVSVDNGVTFASAAATGDYTHLRWTLGRPLAPGSTALLRFRAIFR